MPGSREKLRERRCGPLIAALPVLPLARKVLSILDGGVIPFSFSAISLLISIFVMIFAVFANLIQAMSFTVLAVVYIVGAATGHEGR